LKNLSPSECRTKEGQELIQSMLRQIGAASSGTVGSLAFECIIERYQVAIEGQMQKRYKLFNTVIR
jgi:hypothetical protein